MATKSAGRVSIRVLPDSSRFREDLKLSLTRIEKSMKAEIPAHLVVTRESIRELKQQIRDLVLRVKLDPYVTEEQLHELKRKIENVEPHLRANVDALNAQRRLATLSRDRQVTFFVKLNKASVAGVATTLAALSGTRFIGNIFGNFFERFGEMDKVVAKVGLVSLAIGGLSASILTLISNSAGLLGSFAELGKVFTLAPAIFVGLGISIAILVAAFKDAKKVLKDLAPLFHKFQDDISSDFWGKAANPIREMVKAILPIINAPTAGGLSTAAALGAMFGQMADSLKNNLTKERLGEMFGNLTQGIINTTRAMDPFIHTLTILGLHGSKYLPRLGLFFEKISLQFDNFITKASEDGRLDKWTEDGIKAMKDFGKVIYETGRVFTGLNQAAKRAGGADFEKLAGGLKKLSDTIRKENFQKTFETIFAGAHKAMDGLFKGIGNLGKGIAKFAPTIATIFDTIGRSFEVLGENIALLLSNETLQQGLKDFFSGFLTFLSSLKPAMAPLGRIFGTLATIAGNLVAQFGPLLSRVLILMAPIFEDIWKAIKPLIPDLVKLADTILIKLAPILSQFVRDVLPPLVDLIAALLPLVTAIIKAATPVLSVFFERLAHALKEANPRIKKAAEFLTILVTALNGIPKAFAQLGLGDQKGFFMTMIQFAVDHPEVPLFFSALDRAMGGLSGKIEAVAKTAAGLIFFMQFMAMASSLATPTFLIALSLIFETLVANWTVGIETARVLWQNFWNGLPAPLQAGILAAQVFLSQGLAGIVLQISTWIISTTASWSVFWSGMALRIVLFFTEAQINAANGFNGLILSVTLGLINIGTQFARGWENIVRDIPGWFNKMLVGVNLGIGFILTEVGGMPLKMANRLLSELWRLKDAGLAMMGNFAKGIEEGFPSITRAIVAAVAIIADHLPHSPAKKGPLSGKGWSGFSGQSVVNDFAGGMAARTDALKAQSAASMRAVQLGKLAGANGSAAISSLQLQNATTRQALVHIQGDYYGASPEKVAAEFDKKTRRANLVAQLGKVGK